MAAKHFSATVKFLFLIDKLAKVFQCVSISLVNSKFSKIFAALFKSLSSTAVENPIKASSNK